MTLLDVLIGAAGLWIIYIVWRISIIRKQMDEFEKRVGRNLCE